MPGLLRASVFAVAIFLLAGEAGAEDYGPDDSASFVRYCPEHFDICRTSVIAENNVNMIAVMGGKHGCTFPRTPGQTYHDDTITVTKAILVWLNDHQASLKPKTWDAINQAKQALWPKECR